MRIITHVTHHTLVQRMIDNVLVVLLKRAEWQNTNVPSSPLMCLPRTTFPLRSSSNFSSLPISQSPLLPSSCSSSPIQATSTFITHSYSTLTTSTMSSGYSQEDSQRVRVFLPGLTTGDWPLSASVQRHGVRFCPSEAFPFRDGPVREAVRLSSHSGPCSA